MKIEKRVRLVEIGNDDRVYHAEPKSSARFEVLNEKSRPATVVESIDREHGEITIGSISVPEHIYAIVTHEQAQELAKNLYGEFTITIEAKP